MIDVPFNVLYVNVTKKERLYTSKNQDIILFVAMHQNLRYVKE